MIKNDDQLELMQNNFDKTNDIFYKKAVYESRAGSAGAGNFRNFNFGEFIFYGRMSVDHIPISMVNVRNLAVFRKSNTAQQPQRAFSFVVRVFDAMAAQFDKDAMRNHISPNEKYLSNLSVYRGYESPIVLYRQYKNVYFEQIAKAIRSSARPEQLTNLSQFLTILEGEIFKSISEVPFTYPSFIKSRFCDVMCTGLAIEIADLKYSNDLAKVENFLNSPNWPYYLNVCNSYGFMVDKKYPWRLVADINSEIMIREANKDTAIYIGGYPLLGLGFSLATSTYLATIVDDILQLYNLCISEQYVERIYCDSGKVTQTVKRPKKYTKQTFFNDISIESLLRFYMRLRIYEQKPEMPDNEREALITDCMRLRESEGLSMPMTIFERIISSTIDKNGSFDYHSRHHDAYLREAFEEEKIAAITVTGGGGGY